MITLKEFWESEKILAIHCKEEWQAKKLCCAFDRMGKKWDSGKKYTSILNWEAFKENICYTNYGTCAYADSKYYTMIEFEEIDDFHFNVGDRVRIRQWQDMVNEFGIGDYYYIKTKPHFTKYMKEFCGRDFTIESFIFIPIINERFPVIEFDNSYISTDMLEKVYDDNNNNEEKEEEKECMLGKILATVDDDKEKEIVKEEDKKKWKCFKEQEKIYLEKLLKIPSYSFRFNEERKSVTLYKDGEKVQFVKPQKDDKFSWKTGLGVCLYKQLFKGNKEVEYVKAIVNEKTFYSYCIAKFFNYDKSKVDTLEDHVKNCKRQYCEFQLSKI